MAPTLAVTLAVFMIVPLLVLLQKAQDQEKIRKLVFLPPAPPMDSKAWEYHANEILQLDFHLIDKLDKSIFGLWPSPLHLYSHKETNAWAELTLFPTGRLEIRFLTLFPSGSITTMQGQKRLTLEVLSPKDRCFSIPASLGEVWEVHQGHVLEYEREHSVKRVKATHDAYLDYVHLYKGKLREVVKGNCLVPKTIDDFLFLAFSHLDLMRKVDSEKMLEEAIKLEPENWYLHWIAGRIALCFRDFRKGAEHFQQSLRFNPQDRDSALHLADALVLLHRPKEAFLVLKKGKEMFPKDRLLTLRLGKLATDLGLLEDAETYLEEINNESGASVLLFQTLGRLHRKKGNYKKASEYRRLARVFAKQTGPWENLTWQL